MPTVTISAHLAGASAEEVFDRISDFERYPQLTEAVRNVVVTPLPDGSLVSEWDVTFRNGILRWLETDRVDYRRRTIDFQQFEGDFEAFSGQWSVVADARGCTVGFKAAFDLGMPTLAPMLDPIAESALRDNVTRILSGLAGGPVELYQPT
jgi:ribosome-associated toxin RatA of RatAB toxin-antitoxin module